LLYCNTQSNMEKKLKTQTLALKTRKRPVAGIKNGNLQSINKRLIKVEDEIAAIRRDLTIAPPSFTPKKPSKSKEEFLAGFWADQTQLQQIVDQLFKELSIEGKPIPAEELQELMSESGLEPNELSQAITAAREE